VGASIYSAFDCARATEFVTANGDLVGYSFSVFDQKLSFTFGDGTLTVIGPADGGEVPTSSDGFFEGIGPGVKGKDNLDSSDGARTRQLQQRTVRHHVSATHRATQGCSNRYVISGVRAVLPRCHCCCWSSNQASIR